MLPDSEEINLSTVELQVLSELDSRQYGFLKLNSPDHAKKKALVIKAIKYLERMLIQAQCQQEREKRCKITANDKEIKNADTKSITDIAINKIDTDVEMLDMSVKIKEEIIEDASMNAMVDEKTENTDINIQKDIKIEDTDEDDIFSKDIAIEPRTYCKLGHFHLLLEDYPKALSAYQKFFSLEKDNWKDTLFCYGLGLVYFHYNAYKWATKAFQQLLYVNPDFSRANEVHLRLGLIFKVNNDFDASLKHFQLALLDSSPCTFSKLEIRFHMAHLYEAQNRYKAAREAYMQLLEDKNLTSQLRADIYRQLGWMYHCVDALGDKQKRELQAVGYLQKSIQSDPKSGQSLYLLGRCYAGVSKVHDAFIAYRNSVEKSEGNADTWCSIGVLYQQQNQPMDALQAYICAVQLDKTHRAAWTNLGILYESCSQPRDAYACYLNATKYSKNSSEQIQHLSVSSTTSSAMTNTSTPMSNAKSHAKEAATGDSNGKLQGLTQRLKFLQSQLAHAPMPSITSKRRLLPPIEEAWNLPISAEMSSRQQQNSQANHQRVKTYNAQMATGPPPPYPLQQGAAIPSKRYKRNYDPALSPGRVGGPPQPTPSFYLSQQQLQLLQHLQKNHDSLSPQHQTMLQQLSQQYRMMQQHQQQLRVQQQQQLQHRNAPSAFMGQPQPQSELGPGVGSSGPVAVGQPQAGYDGINNAMMPAVQGLPNNPALPFKAEAGAEFPNANGGYNHTQITSTTNQSELDPEIEALLSRTDIASSLAENLLKQFGTDGIKEEIMDDPMCSVANSNTTASPQNGVADSTTNNVHTPQQTIKCEATSTSARNITTKASDKNEPVLKVENIFDPQIACFDIKMDSKKLAETVKLIDSKEPPSACSILSQDAAPPSPPICPTHPLSREQLFPAVPSLHVDNKKQVFESETQEFCFKHPITVLRGLAAALKLDLGLFATRNLVDINPGQHVEIRTQPHVVSDEQYGKRSWTYISQRSRSTLLKYANYQAASFQDSLRDEQEKGPGSHSQDNDSKDSSSNSHANAKKKKQNKNIPKTIRFATGIDISDDQKWRSQLQELQKLPPFARVVSAANMLSHVGHSILGMNTVHLYMKVPGSRTPSRQANNNFCRANINIGPGDCEWFAVPESHWGGLYALCEKQNINFLNGSWWPTLEDLQREKIPVYRFIQRPGDLVWINAGSVYWVQAVGWCNNVAWNVGPLTGHQYQLSVERYEWNKLQSYRSDIPMVHLTWSLARNIKVSDPMLYESMRNCLMQTLKHVMITLEYVKSKGLEIRLHRRGKTEETHYCAKCEIEVFDVLLVCELDNRHVVYCIGCARKNIPSLQGFVCLEEYRLNELMQVYDAFTLHRPPTPAPPTSPAIKQQTGDTNTMSTVNTVLPAIGGTELTASTATSSNVATTSSVPISNDTVCSATQETTPLMPLISISRDESPASSSPVVTAPSTPAATFEAITESTTIQESVQTPGLPESMDTT